MSSYHICAGAAQCSLSSFKKSFTQFCEGKYIFRSASTFSPIQRRKAVATLSPLQWQMFGYAALVRQLQIFTART